MLVLEYKIDLSRLDVIALDNNKKIKDLNNIFRIERFELPLAIR